MGGLFGITGGQTIRVSVLHAGDKGGINPCTKVFDMSGNLLAEADTDTPLRPGQGTFADFDAAAFGLREGERKQVRVEVELEGSNPPDDSRPVRAGDAILTLEVFDNATGKTVFTMPFQPPEPGQPPDPGMPR